MTTFILVYLTQYAQISTQGIAVVTGIITAAQDLRRDQRSRHGKHHRHDPHPLGQVAAVHPVLGRARGHPVALLFAVPDTSESVKLVYFGVCYFLWGFAYTLAMCRIGA